MELHDQAGLIIVGIAALRFRPLQIFELKKLSFFAAEACQPLSISLEHEQSRARPSA